MGRGRRGGGGQNMQALMQQAQRMQAEMEQKQQELESQEFTASSGGNMVTCVCTGAKEIVSITISPEVVDAEDVEMLEDLVLSAVNAALGEADAASAELLGSLAAGIPGMPGMGR